MGLIRGALLIFASVVFFFAVLSSAMFLTISSSLAYSSVQNQTVNIVNQFSSQINVTQEITNRLPTIINYCKSDGNYSFQYQNNTFKINCSDLNKSISTIINGTINNFIRDTYYANYSCNYWDCFDKYQSTFLISQKSRNYWQNWFYYSMIALLISGTALFFLVKKKRHLPFVMGTTIIVASLIVLELGNLLGSITNETVSQLVSIFFSKSTYIFIRLLIIGGIIMLIGLAMELFHVEFKIYTLLSKLGIKRAENKNKAQKDSSTKKK